MFSCGFSTHYREHIQLSIASGICQTLAATFRYGGGVGISLELLHDSNRYQLRLDKCQML